MASHCVPTRLPKARQLSYLQAAEHSFCASRQGRLLAASIYLVVFQLFTDYHTLIQCLVLALTVDVGPTSLHAIAALLQGDMFLRVVKYSYSASRPGHLPTFIISYAVRLRPHFSVPPLLFQQF